MKHDDDIISQDTGYQLQWILVIKTNSSILLAIRHRHRCIKYC